MSSFDLCKSKKVYPLKKLNPKKLSILNSDFSSENNKISDSLKIKNSKKISSSKNNKCVSITNESNAHKKLLCEAKISKMKLNNLKSKYKNLIFNTSREKISLKSKIKNKKIIQLNSKFHKENILLNIFEDIYKKNTYFKQNKKNESNIKIDLNKIIKEKNLITNIFNIENKKEKISEYFNDFPKINLKRNQLFDRPSSLRIYDYKKNNNFFETEKLEQNNTKLKLEFGSFNHIIKNKISNQMEKNSDLINNQIFNIREKKSESSEKDNKSYNNIFTSEKPINNYILNQTQDILKKNLFKIKRISKKNDKMERNNFFVKLINNNNSEDSSNPFYKNKFKKNNNIKIILKTEEKVNVKALNEQNKESAIKGDISSNLKEIILKESAIKEINIIKKNSNGEGTKGNNEDEEELKKLEKYKIDTILGEGSYATVKLVKNKINNEKYAMKIYDKKKINNTFKKNLIKNEIEILKLINHKNIVKLIEDIKTNNQIIIVQEFVEGFSLKNYYNKEIKGEKNISDDKLKTLKIIFKQIFEAMNYLHKNNISHRDIKMENILMNNKYEVKIIDFGFGLYNPEHNLQKFFCGTPKYIAPEILMGNGYYGEKADLWSLGVLIYKIYCKGYPFKGKNERELYYRIRAGTYTLPKFIPDYIKNLIANLIIIEPMKRIDCESILNSPWMKTNF